MARHDDTSSNGVEFLDFGVSVGGDDIRAPRPRPPWLPPLIGIVVLAGVIGAMVARHGGHHPTAPAAPAPTTTRSSLAVPSSTPAPGRSAPPVSVTAVGHPLLGVRGNWELFGRGPGVVVRVQMASGRITRTAIPSLFTDGPVSFLVGADRSFIRPLDAVPAYVVDDGKPAREVPTSLSPSGPAFAGPDQNHIWVEAGDSDHNVMVLSALSDSRAEATMPVPAYSSPSADGAGYLLFSGTGGVYDAKPGNLRRITTGSLLAAGRTGWLVVECDDQARCATVAVSRADWSHRVVGPALAPYVPTGAISPDGHTAAVFAIDPAGTQTVSLLDMDSGKRRPVRLPLAQSGEEATVAWSPDSRWLFVVSADGQPRTVDPHTGKVGSLGVGLPEVSQLAIRPN